MWHERVTPCKCAQPGWCERHQMHKPMTWFVLCGTSQQTFEEWEAGRGPRWDGSAVTMVAATRRSDCRCRGEILSHLDCECCGGRIAQTPVFTCEKFGRCLEHVCRPAPEEIRVCQTCSEYESPN